MGALQPWHWLILLAVIVVLFGSKRLPDAARSLGKSMRIFKSEVKDLNSDSSSNNSNSNTSTPPSGTSDTSSQPPPGMNHTDTRSA